MIKIRKILTLVLSAICTTALAISPYDLQKPFGFCTVSSRTSSDSTYNITGGGCYKYPIKGVKKDRVITLTATGKDMKQEITKAVKDYDVIVFDGQKGDFIVSSIISFKELKNKTLLGINHAKLCTTWFATQEIIKALNDAGVPQMSSSKNTGGTLSNGHKVSEEAEFNTRQIIINMTGDEKEAYRNSGVFFFKDCENLIIRNLTFQGPGSIDVGGSDLVSLYGSKHCWIDHCDFMDGMDGNFDITRLSDFITVSWCTFSYNERSYMHQNTNLVGANDNEQTGYLNITYAFNEWGKGCKARMPMARVGKIHMLNNYYNCAGNATNCINPRRNSEFLIEGNYFEK
ncbi:MAG: hypothetical protein J6P01_05930, partial [Prevotella sp.]|nr:hypothetical protein [Prevotella sp.]